MFYFDSSELPKTKKPPQIHDPQRPSLCYSTVLIDYESLRKRWLKFTIASISLAVKTSLPEITSIC